MKTLIVLSSLLLSVSTFATNIQCSSDAAGVFEQISAKNSCYDAKAIAETCAYGSSVDVGFVSAAKEVCFNELVDGRDSLSQEDESLLQLMEARCDKSYGGKMGSMFASMNAFCQLDAAKFIIDNVLSEEF